MSEGSKKEGNVSAFKDAAMGALDKFESLFVRVIKVTKHNKARFVVQYSSALLASRAADPFCCGSK